MIKEDGASTQAQTLRRFIQASVEDLVANEPRGSRTHDGLLFLGAWHDAYPAILVRDPSLTDSAKVHLLYLMQEARQNPHGAITLPSVEQTTRVLRQSRGTVIRDRTLLRVTRWITLCQRIREPSGRFAGSIYAINGEPASLADAIHLDDGYMELLEQAAAGHYDPAVKAAAHGALEAIDRDVAAGRDPMDSPDVASRRLTAAETLVRGHGSFYALFLDDVGRPPAGEPPGEQAGEAHRSMEPAMDSGPRVQNLDPGRSKSEPRPPGPGFEPRPEKRGSNPEPGQQLTERESGSEFEPGSSNSSSSKKRTTTGEQSDRGSKSERPLRWPEQLDANHRRLVQRVLRDDAPPEQHQRLIDALAARLSAADRPVRSPVSYVAALCRRLRSGDFRPVAPDQDLQERRMERARLQGEVRALQRLLGVATSEPQRASLNQQLASTQARIDTLAELAPPRNGP